MKAQRGSSGIALVFNLDTRWGCVADATPRPLYPREEDLVPIGQEAGWASGPVWTNMEYLGPTGIRSPDRPAHSKSLYELGYPSPQQIFNN